MEGLFIGFTAITWKQLLMMAVGGVLIYLAIKKEYEPALLLPIGFGTILVNIPYSSVLDQVEGGRADRRRAVHIFPRRHPDRDIPRC